MARITIEDCLAKIGNHFQLVLVASQRARQLQQGATPKIEVTDEKPCIIALREIATGLTDEEVLNEPLMKDVAAGEELVELISHELKNQSKTRPLGSMDEDEVEEEEDGTAITRLPLETIDLPETFDDQTSLGYLEDESPPGSEPLTSDALNKKLSESENAVADKLLTKTFGETETRVDDSDGEETETRTRE